MTEPTDENEESADQTLDAHAGDQTLYDPQVTEIATGTQDMFAGPLKRAQPMVGNIPREIPVRLGRYVIDGEIGRGAMGVVYKARQEGLDRPVALKILLRGEFASARMKKRFEREAQSIAKLRHPNIVSVHEVGDFDGQPFFTMELIDGLQLDVFSKRVNMSPKIIADMCRRIALAADYAHKNGIIHRDLKPSNVIVDRQSEPIITDFGLAKEMDNYSMLSMTGDVMGTPAYMAPEQAEGKISEVGARSDVYSLGSILYAMLVRRDPFQGKTMVETLNKVIHQDPPPVNVIDPRIDEDLAAICMKAMEKNPADRYYSAKEMARDLENFINGRAVHARRWGWRRKIGKFAARNRVIVAASGLCVLLAMVASFLSLELVGKDYVDLAERQLSSDNAEVRIQTLETLGKELVAPEVLKPENRGDALQLLLSAWADEDAEVQAALLRILSEQDVSGVGSNVTDPMADWLKAMAQQRDDPALAGAALAAIGKIQRADFAQYLIGQLREPNPTLRLRVVRSLGNQRSRDALSPLMNLIVSDPICRGEAEAALEKFYEGGRLALFSSQDRMAKSALHRLQNALGQYQDQVNSATGEETTGADAAWTPYRDALQSEDESTRLQAVNELGRTGEAEASLILLELLEKEDSVGAAAAVNLGRTGQAEAVSRLPALLQNDQSHIRKNAAIAMGFSTRTEFSDTLLVAAAQEGDDLVRDAMISAVGEIGDVAAVPTLKNLAREFPGSGNIITKTLQRLPGPRRGRPRARPGELP